jgi:hypothetical protein
VKTRVNIAGHLGASRTMYGCLRYICRRPAARQGAAGSAAAAVAAVMRVITMHAAMHAQLQTRPWDVGLVQHQVQNADGKTHSSALQSEGSCLTPHQLTSHLRGRMHLQPVSLEQHAYISLSTCVISRVCYSEWNAQKACKSAMQGHHQTKRMPSSVEAGAPRRDTPE